MRYPAVRICLNGSFVPYDLPAIDVYDPSEGRARRSPSVAGTSSGSAWATPPSP